MTQTMDGGAAIIKAALRHGVDTLFGLPGAQMYPLFEALANAKNQIRTVSCRHEQAAAYMAFGYAQATGRPGLYSVVPGPGILNTTAALCTAYGCNVPVLALTGQIPSAFLGKGRGHLHELPDQLATLRTLVKWADRIDRPADAPAKVDQAFAEMLSGRPGPVSLEMCWDIMASSESVEIGDVPALPAPPAPDPDSIRDAVAVLKDAKRPMIFVGGGARHASAAVTALAERLGAPVTAMRSGRGVVAEDHPLGLNSAAAWELWSDTDVLIGIGSRLELPYMRWTGMRTLIEAPEAPPTLIRIDIDEAEMTRLKPHHAICGDADVSTRQLLGALEKAGISNRPETDRIATAEAVAAEKMQKIQPQMQYLEAIRAVLPRDGFFVEELCQAGFASYYGFPIYHPRTYITAGYQGTLGFGFPTALGVKVAHPDRAVVAIAGDGGFGFGLQELATAAQENIGVVTVLFNNNAYGNVRRDQMTQYEGRHLASELNNPNFIQLAESFGVHAEQAASPEALKTALERNLAADKPAVIEVPLDPDSEASPWPLIIPGIR